MEDNPWLVPSFDDFLQYVCPEPECSEKYRMKCNFIKHALLFHEEANAFIDGLVTQSESTNAPKSQIDKSNPWMVAKFEDLQFYYCPSPECNFKVKTRAELMKHGLVLHPKSNALMNSLVINIGAPSTSTEKNVSDDQGSTLQITYCRSISKVSEPIDKPVTKSEDSSDSSIEELSKDEVVETGESKDDTTD